MRTTISATRMGGKWSRKYQTNGGIFSKDIRHWDIAPPPEYFKELARVSKNQIIWGGNYFDLPPTRCFIVWHKLISENFSMSMCEYAWTSFNDNAKLFECAPQGTAKEKRFGLEKFVYDGYLLPAERVTVSLNGTITECIHLFRTPPLYDYAEKRKQIGRMSVKLLNSPVNKNEETIALQGYLYRRILSMKGSSKLSPTIKYDTVYKQLEITASSDGALRKKKLKVRESVKKALDYFKKEGFIKGYVENSHKGDKNRLVSVTIRY